jgi:hypothetical protein
MSALTQPGAMKMLLASHVDPMVQDAEIEHAFLMLHLFPRNRNQHHIEMHPRQLGQYGVRLRRCTGRRVAEFAPTDKNGLPWTISCPAPFSA